MFKNDNLYINSNDFASFADLIYSNRDTYKNKAFEKNTEVIEINNDPKFNCVVYKKIIFDISSGDVIFCNSNHIDNLFFHLKKFRDLENITLITHQTDKLVTKKQFTKKPDCVTTWYSVNVSFESESLKPIPIGIASDFSFKNLTSKDFPNFNPNNYKKNQINLYINFQTNTNYSERKGLYRQFSNENWVNFDSPDLDKNLYLSKLQKASFVLCPWGNGIDTHRFWEALYSGSIPITKFHPTYSTAKNLPVLFVDDYKKIDRRLLEEFMTNLDLRDYDFSVLTKEYWINILKEEKAMEVKINKIVEKKFETLFFKFKRDLIKYLNLLTKRCKTLINRLIKKIWN